MRRPLYLAVFIFGFAAMAVQILLMRELLVVFYGNELSAGIMLASWLFWVAAGSFAARFKKFREGIFHLLLLSVAVIVPATIYLIRDMRNILGVSAGELIGLAPMALSVFILLAPACFVFGSLFAVSCLLASPEPGSAPSAAGKIYMIESLGAVAGGIAFNLLLIYIFGPLQIALFCGLLSIIAALIMADRRKAPVRWAATAVFMYSVAIYILFPSGLADFRMREMQWKGLELISVKDSKYGNIALTRLGPQFNLFENGLLTAATGDLLTAEESVHYAMLEHPAPKKVLLIGGALNGALDEVLRHPVESVDCVELDPESVEMAKERYGDTLSKGGVYPLLACLSDPRVKMHYLDARLFVKERALALDAPSSRYDVIILTLPNPYTAQINRFYSFEFYGEAKRILDEKGIFSFGVSSSADYISADLARFLKCLVLTLSKHFSDIKIIPGENDYFLASTAAGILTYDYKTLIARAKERGLNLKYVNEHYLPDKLDPMRVEYLEAAIKGARGAKINFDLRPVGYYYDMVLWSERVDPRLKSFFRGLSTFNWGIMLGIAGFAFIGLALLRGRNASLKRMPYFVSIGTSGFSTMLLQVVLILAFQSAYGYVYYKIGLIFASFMLGLAGGSFIGTNLIKNDGRLARQYFNIQAGLCAYCLLLPVVFRLGWISEGLFLLLPAAAGLLGGLQFTMANRICSGGSNGNAAPAIYAVDLLGACAGSLITAAIMIPVKGIEFACISAGFVNLAVLVLLAGGDQLFRSRT
ncbi:MAG: hypothetical protein PHO67_07255 [Candidatus Omnitrophica bacterium]|nr:hypothetical protein [Candidatus Omnitrophota bacterium]